MNLFLLSFAGGNRYSFSGIKKYLPAEIGFCPLDLPGRASRMSEPLVFDMKTLAEDVYRRIAGTREKGYALFGHCIGALLAFLVSRKAVLDGYPPPDHLVVSGCRAPSELKGAGAMDLSEQGLRERMLQLGMSATLLNHDGFYDMIAPIMKADLTAFNNYVYESAAPLPIPITVIREKECRFTADEAMFWQAESVFPVRLSQLQGPLNASYPILASILATALQESPGHIGKLI